MANETPSRPPPRPPFMANAILNFHFDFLHPSLIHILSFSFVMEYFWQTLEANIKVPEF